MISVSYTHLPMVVGARQTSSATRDVMVTVSLFTYSDFSAKQAGMSNPSSITSLVALLVCLAPTTIGEMCIRDSPMIGEIVLLLVFWNAWTTAGIR